MRELKKSKVIPLTKGMSLYDAFRNEQIVVPASCGGRGNCGACRIRVLQGNLPVTQKDLGIFSEEELQDGWRLACAAYPKEKCTVLVPKQASAFILQGKEAVLPQEIESCGQEYSIAVDLGTTTIAYEVFETDTGRPVRMRSSVNSQCLYGADVISRMEQSENGRRDLLKNILRRQMREDIAVLTDGMEKKRIGRIRISANTAMVHLFMGYDCEGLSRYPFLPHTLEEIRTDAAALNLMEEPVDVFVTQGVSAYVGGDVLAGMALQKMVYSGEKSIFIDLGTNAEMAVSDGKGTIYVTSAPAGPAFEAANISCGTGSIEGAVSGMRIDGTEQYLTTIGEKEPVGFCGSGILEAVYELRKNGILDETGLLCDEYFEKGYPVQDLRITQEDIRQIQLAKSAVSSALSILLKKACLEYAQIEHIYFAGGFGCCLNVKKAAGIGLLPEEFVRRTVTVGNASLLGTKALCMGKIEKRELDDIQKVCKEIYLSNEERFQDIFVENMNFPMLF